MKEASSNPVVLNSSKVRICTQEILVKKLLLVVLSLCTFSVAAAGKSDVDFVNKFANYKAKHNTSTFKAAKAWGTHLKQSPDKILKRYIGAKFEAAKNTDSVVVEAVDAFKESGLSYEKSLSAVSDIVGQLTETLNTIYTRASGAKGSGIASNR